MKRLSCWLLALASSIAPLQAHALEWEPAAAPQPGAPPAPRFTTEPPTTQPRPAAGLVWSSDPSAAAQDAATRLA